MHRSNIDFKPLDGGPLAGVEVPKTLEDVELQLCMLRDYYDLEWRHVEADRLLLLALQLTSTSTTRSQISDIVTAFNNIEKAYA